MRTLEQAQVSAEKLRPFMNSFNLIKVEKDTSEVLMEDIVVLANEVIRLRSFIDQINKMTMEYSDTKR